MSEEMVALVLFSTEVSKEEKAKMAAAMRTQDEGAVREVRRPPLTIAKELSLDRLFSKATGRFFRKLGHGETLFELGGPDEWEKKQEHENVKSCLVAFPVVNDCAERAVKLVQDFNQVVMNNEKQKQFLL